MDAKIIYSKTIERFDNIPAQYYVIGSILFLILLFYLKHRHDEAEKVKKETDIIKEIVKNSDGRERRRATERRK